MSQKNQDMTWIPKSVKTPSPGLIPEEAAFIKTVEWEMLNKSKFFPMSMVSNLTVRCILYPLTLIRTRLQVQKGKKKHTLKIF